MSLSRNVNLDIMSAVMRVMRGLQTVMCGRQGLSTIIERSIIGRGLILLMGVYRYDRHCGRRRD